MSSRDCNADMLGQSRLRRGRLKTSEEKRRVSSEGDMGQG